MPRTPLRFAISAVGEMNDRTSPGVLAVAPIQPKPSPVPAQIAASTTPNSTAIGAPAHTRSFSRPCHLRATITDRNGSASTAGIFTVAPTVMMATPSAMKSNSPFANGGGLSPFTRTGSRRMPISSPATMSPMASESLCAPATKWKISNGFAAPSHSAVAGCTPNRRASRGTAHTISSTPTIARPRCSSTPTTMLLPPTGASQPPSRSSSGPYGAGVSRQMLVTPAVSGSATPSACAGPSW
ncbi:hypothetical protein A4R44_02422 [Amycolatopsis sp. M39]|nr:hypothetical protein A4R44_02422 [Amycolatopsis sp. M39]